MRFLIWLCFSLLANPDASNMGILSFDGILLPFWFGTRFVNDVGHLLAFALHRNNPEHVHQRFFSLV